MLVAGCRSIAPAPPVVAGAPPGPWAVVAADLGTQRLFRVQARQGNDDASLRLVLRLAAAERFEVTASDPLGRPLWTLTVDDGAGRWLPAGQRSGCRFDPRRSVRLARFDWGLPARDLAAALVGRVPEPPARDGAELAVEYLDASGRRWRAWRDERGPLRWSTEQAGAPSLSWERAERGGALSAESDELLIRWREVTREPLGGGGPRLPAAAAGEPECDDAALS